jgi:hypothetical protein
MPAVRRPERAQDAETGDMAAARVSLTAAARIFEQAGDRVGAAQTASLLATLTVS